MICNIPCGGSAFISVTAPSGAAITATCSGITVTGTGTCTLPVPITGTWSVSCVYDSTTKTNSVSVSSLGSTYSTSFTYSATISVTVPSGASVTASMSGQTAVTRTGSGSMTVHKIGNWTVQCAYDGLTKTETINVAAYGSTYSKSFMSYYNCTISVNTTPGASLSCAMSGQTTQTGTASNSGTYTFTVGKKGNWTVTSSIGSGTGAASKSATANAVYGGTATVNVYPKYYIFNYGNPDLSTERYIGPCGLAGSTNDTSVAEFNTNYTYGSWRVAYFFNKNGGNHKLWTTSTIPLKGYTKICIRLRERDCDDLYYTDVGAATSQANFSDYSTWSFRKNIAGATAVNVDNFTVYECSISSTSSLYVALRIAAINKGVIVQDWWLE